MKLTNPKNRVFVPCRLSFPRLSSAVHNELSGKDEYSVVCVIPKDDTKTITTLRNVMKEVFCEKFSQDKFPPVFRKTNFFEEHLSADGKDGFFLRDGDLNSDKNDKLANCVYFTARDGAVFPNKPHAPECAMKRDNKVIRLQGDRIDEELYAGCDAVVVIDVFAYDSKVNKGLGCSLRAVVKTGDNERWGGASKVDFESAFGCTVVDEEPSVLEEGLDNL